MSDNSTLSKITQISAVGSAGAIALSIFYDLAYFMFVDIRLVSRLTIQDHIASGIAHLPFALVVQLSGVGLGWLFFRQEQKELYKIEDEVDREKPKKILATQKNKELEYIVIATAAIAIILFLFGDMYIVVVYTTFAAAAVLYALHLFLAKNVDSQIHTTVLVILLIAFAVFGKAASAAIDDQRISTASIIIVVDDEVIQASALRTFPDSVIYFSEGIPTLIRSDNIRKITYTAPLRDLTGRGFCDTFGMCLRKQESER
jgi:hypothetical protein